MTFWIRQLLKSVTSSFSISLFETTLLPKKKNLYPPDTCMDIPFGDNPSFLHIAYFCSHHSFDPCTHS